MTELLEFAWPLHRAGYAIRSGDQLQRKRPRDALMGALPGEELWVVPAAGPHSGDMEALVKTVDLREPLKLGLCVYRNFLDCDPSPEGVLEFTESYGFLRGHSNKEPQGMLVSEWQDSQQSMRAAVDLWEQGEDVWQMVFDFNSHELGHLKTKLRANRSGKGVFVVLQPESLWAMMWLEFALQISNKSGIRQCEWCNKWFPYGSGTGRRSKARFCADACRKANHVNEKKKEQVK